MNFFQVDPRDSYQQGGACNTCCCQDAQARPGETNKWSIDYAPWSAPIGGKGLSNQVSFSIELKTPCAAEGSSNPPPVNTDYSFATDINTAIAGNVSDNASDTNGDPLTYEVLPLYGASFGLLDLAVDGTFTYTPNTGFSGHDVIWFSTSDGINPPVVKRLVFIVSQVAPAVPLPELPDYGAVHVRQDRVKVDARRHNLEFPLVVTPEAQTGDVYRLTIRQAALDCDCECYWHVSCYDIVIGKC